MGGKSSYEISCFAFFFSLGMWILKLWGWALALEYVHNVLIMSASQWSINAIIACAFFLLFNQIWHMKNLDSCCCGGNREQFKKLWAMFHDFEVSIANITQVATCRRREKGSRGEHTSTGRFTFDSKRVLINLNLRLWTHGIQSVRYLLYTFVATTFRILKFAICISV